MPILVIDDEPQIRFLISELLSDEGYTVVQAANGREALIYLQAANPLPSLILLDMMMPILNGWEFLRVQQRNPVFAPIPVVVISAFRALAESAAALGVQEALTKPIDLDRLVDLVQRYYPSVPPP
jgi:two-component system, chemotaxis family, chemotaxis protein CheY